MSLYDYLVSLWRTLVSILLTIAAAWAAKIGLDIHSTAVALWLGGAFSTVYYAAFRWAEAHVSVRWGWLLGLAAPPTYQRPNVTSATPAAIEDRS